MTDCKIAGLEVHPAALLLPRLTDAERLELRTSIADNGLRHPIVLDTEGRILDGRHRAQECHIAGVVPRFDTYEGDDPIAYVMDANIRRRHLSESQLGMLAVDLLPLYEAEARDRKVRAAHKREAERAASRSGSSRVGKSAQSAPEPAEPLRARDQAAAAVGGVSSRTVESAAVVRDRGAPELAAAVRSGAIAVSTAADLTDLTLTEQVELIARGDREILAAAKGIRATRQAARRGQRIERMATIAQGNRPLDAGPERYAVLYADPPWRYKAPISDSRVIENHYPTMTIEEIAALPVAQILTPDAIVFLWVPAPFDVSGEAQRIVDAWGLKRIATKTVWVKDAGGEEAVIERGESSGAGMGRWQRIDHEYLYWCVRGAPPTPAPSLRPSSVVYSPRGEHSVKPVSIAEFIETAYAGLPRIELFCRDPRPGWAAWGNQSGGKTAQEDDHG